MSFRESFWFGLELFGFAYLCGFLPFGVLIGYLTGKGDIRDAGGPNASGGIGATHSWRVLGGFWGSLVFALDVLKGLPMGLLAKKYGFSEASALLIGGGACLGHSSSLLLWAIDWWQGTDPRAWRRKKGGKIVATSLGLLLSFDWQMGLLVVVVYGLAILIGRMSSLGSICAALSLLIGIWFRPHEMVAQGIASFIAIVIVWKHRENIKRMRAGLEPKVDSWKWLRRVWQWLKRRGARSS